MVVQVTFIDVALTEPLHSRWTRVFRLFLNCPIYKLWCHSEDRELLYNRGPAALKLISLSHGWLSRDWLLGTDIICYCGIIQLTLHDTWLQIHIAVLYETSETNCMKWWLPVKYIITTQWMNSRAVVQHASNNKPNCSHSKYNKLCNHQMLCHNNGSRWSRLSYRHTDIETGWKVITYYKPQNI